MASLIRPIILKKVSEYLRSAPLLNNPHRNASGQWLHENKPGFTPKTEQERIESAKRYGLTPEEYKHYDEERGFGDYPKLPDIGADSRDESYPWDYPSLKRNFNEPWHAHSELYGQDRVDPSLRLPIPLKEQWCWFLGTIALSYAIFFFLEQKQYRFQRPVTQKQMPGCGTHYTFSPE